MGETGETALVYSGTGSMCEFSEQAIALQMQMQWQWQWQESQHQQATEAGAVPRSDKRQGKRDCFGLRGCSAMFVRVWMQRERGKAMEAG